MMTVPQGESRTRFRKEGSARRSQSTSAAVPRTMVFLAGGALLVYTAMLILAMHVPGHFILSWSTVKLSMPIQTVFHFLAYAGLTVLVLVFATAVRWVGSSGRFHICKAIVWKTLVLIGVYSFVDEVTQPFTHRACQLADWLADIAGALIAALLVVAVLRVGRSRFGWQASEHP